MKNLSKLIASAFIIAAIVACGDSNSIDAKKTKLEQLKSQQAEITAQIETLQEEILKSGDSVNTNDIKAKYVAVTTITPETFIHSVDVQGRIDGEQDVTITAKASGSITKIHFRAGATVKAKQIIAEIDNEMVRAQLKELKTNLELVTKLYEKQKNLWDEKVGTEIQYLQAKANKESLEARLAQAQKNLDMYLIEAPIDGIVDDMPLKVGQVVAPGIPCARVVNLNNLKVKAELSEAYTGNIKDGDKVELYFPDINKNATSSITYASKVINQLTRTFSVEIKLPGDNSYRPNMITEIRIIDYKKDNAIVVPINTVQQVDGQHIVYVAVKEGNKITARKREVKTGKMYNGKTEILSGLNPEDALITTGFQDLTDGEIIQL